MKALHDKLIADLTAEPRPLTDHVVRTLMDRLELDSNEVADFLTSRTGSVDEALLDTIFSPMYTPDWDDRARYVADRERLDITPAVLSAIVAGLVEEGLTATYLYEDDTITMPLPEVVIDRWVRRLHLDVALSERVTSAIEATVPNGHQDHIKALAGHTAWRTAGREEILIAFLTGYSLTGRFTLPKFEYLTSLMQTYRPRDIDHFAQQVDALVKSYQEEKNEQFFDDHLKEAHGHSGGGSTPVKNDYAAERQRQLSLATQIQQDISEFPAAAMP